MNSVTAPVLAAPELHLPENRAPHRPASARANAALPVSILGIPFDNITIDETLSRVDDMIASRRPHYLVTANVDFLVQAHRDVELRRILLDADLVLCDGTPLVWASRLLGNPLPERVAGSDLVPALIRRSASKGHRIFFLGAGPGVAAEATARLNAEYPLLNIVGHYSPPFSGLLEMDHAAIAQRIREARPDILLVSFGCPKQEKWIAMHYRSLGVPVCIGVGATLDFLAGRVKRAPAWMRRSGTEWLYRLVQEPRRLYKRYATDLVCFLPTLLRQWWQLTTRPRVPRLPRQSDTATAQWRYVDVGDCLTRAQLQRDASFWQALPEQPAHCLVDATSVRHVDGTGLAFLLRCRKALHARGRQLVLLSPSRALRRTLAVLRVADYFPIADNAAEALGLAARTGAETPVLHDTSARSLAWCGEVVAGNVDEVWEATSEHIAAFARQGSRLVIIDLSRLRFIDSAGAGLMLRLKKWAQQFPAEVLFARPQPNIHNVLRLTRLDQLLLEGAQ